MKFIITIALLALGSSLSFYHQSEIGYVIYLVLVFVTGHYAGHVSQKVQSLVSGEHKLGVDNCIYKQDLLWLVKEITSPIEVAQGSKEAREIMYRIEQIKRRVGYKG